MMDISAGHIQSAGDTRAKGLASERGMVLVVVVVLSAIALAVATSLLYMISTGTKISGMERNYRTAKDASYGAVPVLGQLIFTMQTNTTTAWLGALNYSEVTAGCVSKKIKNEPSLWSGCTGTGLIDPGNTTTFDFSLEIGTSPVYKVFAKIVDTIKGNTMGSYAGSEAGSHIDTHQGVVSTQSELPVESIPYSYVIELYTRNLSSAKERSRLQLFYYY